MLYEVTDDSGFLGIINPDLYKSFVDEDWRLELLFEHFKMEIREENLLLWGTGCEGTWRVEVRDGISNENGVREFHGFINVTAGRLCLTNYESLTMAAQFADVKLPEEYQKDLLIQLSNGIYHCRIVQLVNPEDISDNGKPYDFLIEFKAVSTGENTGDHIPWYEDI